MVAGRGERRHHAAHRADVRYPGSADGRRARRWPAHRELPGPATAQQLRRWVDSPPQATAGKLSGSGEEAEQVDPALAQARAHLDQGNFDEALKAYEAILEAQPNHPEAKGAVRQIGFLQRATAQRPDAVEVADAAPDDIEAAFAAADVEILAQQVSAAFDRLIALIKRTAGDDRTKVRTRLIELFELFDPQIPR